MRLIFRSPPAGLRSSRLPRLLTSDTKCYQLLTSANECWPGDGVRLREPQVWHVEPGRDRLHAHHRRHLAFLLPVREGRTCFCISIRWHRLCSVLSVLTVHNEGCSTLKTSQSHQSVCKIQWEPMLLTILYVIKFLLKIFSVVLWELFLGN